MKVGIKKLHENEWLIHIGNAAVKLDEFSIAILNITLEHLLALEHGDTHSALDSYIHLGERIKKLKTEDLQKFIPMVDSRHILNLLLTANSEELNELVLKNMGLMLAKQFESDLANSEPPEEEDAKESIKIIIEKMFSLEAQGLVEVVNEQTEYI